MSSGKEGFTPSGGGFAFSGRGGFVSSGEGFTPLGGEFAFSGRGGFVSSGEGFTSSGRGGFASLGREGFVPLEGGFAFSGRGGFAPSGRGGFASSGRGGFASLGRGGRFSFLGGEGRVWLFPFSLSPLPTPPYGPLPSSISSSFRIAEVDGGSPGPEVDAYIVRQSMKWSEVKLPIRLGPKRQYHCPHSHRGNFLNIKFVYGRLIGQQGHDTWDLSLNVKRNQVVPVPPFHVSAVVCIIPSLHYLASGGLRALPL